jgi:ubiquinone/menaquinone biosynthesis C-methylase UbiE
MYLQKSKNQYTKFASPYAAIEEDEFSKRMAKFVLKEIQRYHLDKNAHVIDLACGIGTACIIFAKHGYCVTGVDASAEMLAEAQSRSDTLSIHVNWIQQDMRKLKINNSASLVTCMYDSLNFMLAESELLSVFKRVNKVLSKNGLFIFDMYTIRGLAKKWGTKYEIHTNTESYFVTSKTKWDYKTHTDIKTLYGFTRKKECWERWEEIHVLKAYPLLILKKLLKESGFSIKKLLDWNAEAKKSVNFRTNRVVFVTQK